MDLFTRFSSRENLKKAYEYVQYEFAHSSLAIAPITHATTTAINSLGEQFFIGLENYLRSGDYSPERGFFVYIPKDNLGLRPVCVLSMIDRIVYQALFNQDILGFKLDAQLSEKVCFANRINDDEKSDQFLSPYFNQWDSFCEKQEKAFEDGYTWKMDVDVQQYYENISIKKLIQKLKDDFGVRNDQLLSLLEKLLCASTEDVAMPKGIPQGPDASAVLGNVYLASLDKFVEEELTGENLQYVRYADDIVLMGKNKTDILVATEKIVHFLRGQNLVLNEKTKLEELSDSAGIVAMKVFSMYDEDTTEIPADEHAQIQEKVPGIIWSIRNGERVEKRELREFKYFLATGTNYDVGFLLDLIAVIPIRPSLVAPIVRYVGEGRTFLNQSNDFLSVVIINSELMDLYGSEAISEWMRFWLLKLFVSSKDITIDIGDEIKKILASKNRTIFKVVAFYYQAITGEKIKIEQVKSAIQESQTDVEKSVFSFFLLNAFEDSRVPVIRECIETTMNADSMELNLIGCYLNKNNDKTLAKEADGAFSRYLLNQKSPQKERSQENKEVTSDADFFMVSKANLIPIDSPAKILGVNRRRRVKGVIEFNLPEMVNWEKVTLKIKEGLQDVEIWYGKDFIETTDYIRLGFYSGEKEKQPDRKWKFLTVLSVYCGTRIQEATVTNMINGLSGDSEKKVRPANVHQIKRGLVKALRAIFKTDDDPFYENRDYYQPKFTLVPEPALRVEVLRRQGGRLNENLASDDDEDVF